MTQFTTRLQRVRENLKASQIDGLALIPGFNFRYITGIDFLLLERPLILFIPQDPGSSPALVLPELEVTSWLEATPFDVKIFPWSDQEGPSKAVEDCFSYLPSMQSIGVEQLRMRVQEFQLIHSAAPGVNITAGETVTSPIRMRKDSSEIAYHRKAVQICEQALEFAYSSLEFGMTERQVCNRLMNTILDLGGDMIPIEPTVLSGPNSAHPHGKSGERKVSKGDILLIDFVSTYKGYYADITRTCMVGGEPDDRFLKVYEAVRKANEAGRSAVRPGATCEQVDRAARQVLVDASLGSYFTHRTGHGLGLDVHEDPGIVEGNQTRLEEGMIFTIEPGVYIEGWGGVRIEDDVVVTKDGCESLTTLNRALRTIK